MSVAYIGDLDGDGVSELCLTAMDYAAQNFAFRDSTTTSATIRLGASGAVLREIYRSSSAHTACEAAVALGDVDGDGAGDVALLINGRGTNGSDIAGELRTVSSRSGEQIGSIPLDGYALRAGQLASIADLDRDGVRDLLIATGRQYESEAKDLVVLVRSGRTGAAIRMHAVPDRAFGCNYLRVLGDVTGDGTEDYAIAWAAERGSWGWTLDVAGSSIVDGRTGEDVRFHEGVSVLRSLRRTGHEQRGLTYMLTGSANAANVGWSMVDGRDGSVLEAHAAADLHRSNQCTSCEWQIENAQFEAELGIETDIPRVGYPVLQAFPALMFEHGQLVCVQHLYFEPQAASPGWGGSVHWVPYATSSGVPIPQPAQAVLGLRDALVWYPESPDGSAVPSFALTKIDEHGASLWIEREGRLLKFADV